jgi:flagellar motor switch protein FliG
LPFLMVLLFFILGILSDKPDKKDISPLTPVPAEGYDKGMKFGQRGLDAYKAQNRPQSKESSLNEKDNSALKALLREEESPENPSSSKPGLLKTGKTPVKGAEDEKEIKGIGKAARFLLLLDKDEAGKVLRNMSEREIEQITAEIARIQAVSLEEAGVILDDFDSSLSPHAVSGGVDMARDILKRAFGEEKSRQLIHKAVPASIPVPFAFMNDLSLPQLLKVLKEEPVESLAIILSFLRKDKSSSYIRTLDREKQLLLIKRMARMQKLHPDVIARMEGFLQERIHKISSVDEVEVDGPAKLTEILKHMNIQEETRILQDLEQKAPDVGRQVKENLLTMESIFQLRSRDLQELLLKTPNEKLVLLMKDKDDRIVEHLLSHLSEQRRMILEEERIIAPLVPRKEVREVTKEFLEIIRGKQEDGRYILLDEEDDYLV